MMIMYKISILKVLNSRKRSHSLPFIPHTNSNNGQLLTLIYTNFQCQKHSAVRISIAMCLLCLFSRQNCKLTCRTFSMSLRCCSDSSIAFLDLYVINLVSFRSSLKSALAATTLSRM